ncbi:MAG: hypothetical protein ABSC94_13570 [Polyangiaceae bacterium]
MRRRTPPGRSVKARLAGAVLFAFAIVGAVLAACTSTNSGAAPCPDTAAAAMGTSCSVPGLACCYGSSNCSCEDGHFTCTNNMSCPAEPPHTNELCNAHSLCIYPSGLCTCNALYWACTEEPADAPRSCLGTLPPAADAGPTTVPCGQADPSAVAPFNCGSADAGIVGCCPEGDIYSYVASACVGTSCPAGQSCQNFICSAGDAGSPESGADAEFDSGSNNPPAVDAAAGDSAADAINDSTTDGASDATTDGANDAETPDSETTDAAVDAAPRDAAADVSADADDAGLAE